MFKRNAVVLLLVLAFGTSSVFASDPPGLAQNYYSPKAEHYVYRIYIHYLLGIDLYSPSEPVLDFGDNHTLGESDEADDSIFKAMKEINGDDVDDAAR